jgi:hypothetical protein
MGDKWYELKKKWGKEQPSDNKNFHKRLIIALSIIIISAIVLYLIFYTDLFTKTTTLTTTTISQTVSTTNIIPTTTATLPTSTTNIIPTTTATTPTTTTQITTSTTTTIIIQACSDGTPYGKCSSIEPKFCDNGNLIDKCSICGCSSNQKCRNDSCGKGSVVLFIDENTYNQLTNEISRFKEDIENDLDVNVFIHHDNFNEQKQIRDIIIDHFNNDYLLGSILIGNILHAFYGDTLSDFYYMDLDPKVDECYNDGKVDKTCLGAYPPAGLYPYIEIWSGRIKPTKPGQEGIEQIRSYLNKDHDYRNGVISYNKRITLVSPMYIFDYKYSQEDYIQLFQDMLESSLLYSSNEAEIIYDTNSSNLKNEYINTLKNQNEFTFLNLHGAPNLELFGGSTILYFNEIESLKPNSMIYELESCSNGDFTAENYIAGTYLFSGNALAVMANSVVSNIVIQESVFKNIGQLRLGIPIGEVYRHKSCDLVCHLFGDPTLRLRPFNLENAPKFKVDSLLVDFGEHLIGTQTEIDYVIKNEGNSKLIIDAGGLVAKLNGGIIGGYIPFYYTFEGKLNKRIEVEPHSEVSIKIYFNLIEGKVNKGVYEGYFFEMPTNDPINPWITINLKGKSI